MYRCIDFFSDFKFKIKALKIFCYFVKLQQKSRQKWYFVETSPLVDYNLLLKVTLYKYSASGVVEHFENCLVFFLFLSQHGPGHTLNYFL